jgi:hypothetical protein
MSVIGRAPLNSATIGLHGHAGATANLKLTFEVDHSAGANHYVTHGIFGVLAGTPQDSVRTNDQDATHSF